MTKPIPKSLDKEGPFWFLRHVHNNVMRKNKHFALLMCGESGGGKSWNSAAIATALYPKFNPQESFAFSPLQFLEMTEVNHPKLFPMIIDDAGLSAFSGDALTSQVKNLSKIAQSIRYKNWQIIFNLPNVDLLAKSVRITNHYYTEPKWIDYKNKLTHIKFQRLKQGRDKLYYKNIKRLEKHHNNVTGYNHITPTKILDYAIPAPPKKITDAYEIMKENFMKRYRKETAETLRRAKQKELGKDTNKTQDAANYMRKQLAEFTTDRGGIDVPKIMANFSLGQSAARIAYNMAAMPRNERDVIKGQRLMRNAKKKHVSWYTGESLDKI